MLSQRFVVDTNVIIIDPYCINKLGGEVQIPTCVLEELDNHKNDNGEKGRNIREFARILEKNKDLNVDFYDTSLIPHPKNDDKIIQVAENTKSVLVTNDIYMSLKAKAVGIKTQRYEPVNIINDSAYNGLIDVSHHYYYFFE